MAGDPLHTRICDMLGAEFPIFAFTHCKDVAAAVTNAGGIGVLGELGRTPDGIAEDIQWLKSRVGDKPFGIDLVFPASIPSAAQNRESLEAQIPEEQRAFVRRKMEEAAIPFVPLDQRVEDGGGGMGAPVGFTSQEAARQQWDAVVSGKPPLFVSGLGSPAFAVEAAHANGMLVGGLIGKVRQARREMEAGVDIIMAQGYDAGGHTGEIGTFTLVPRVVQAAKEFGTPVCLAGGVGTGAHLAAAFALGAEGVWCGSLWLASRENDASLLMKERIIEGTEEDTTRSRALTGKPARLLRSKFTDMWEEPGAPKTLPMPLQTMVMGDLAAGVATNPERFRDWSSPPAGQMIGNITAMKPCAEIVFDLVEEAREVLDRLGASEPTPA